MLVKTQIDMMDDDDAIPISALNTFSYCPRRFALQHLERERSDNIYTVRGKMLHEQTDVEATIDRAGVRIERALPLWSRRLGLIGKADIVEFHGATPYPVEYKLGKKRRWGNDDLQVCAQALCLEEMLNVAVPEGAVYHHGSRRRREVVFDDRLRELVAETVAAIRLLLSEGSVPSPVHHARCRDCSVVGICLPTVVGEPMRIAAWRREE